MPVDWLKLIHEGRLTDDGIKDRNVKKAGLYVAPELTVAWLLIKGKAVLSKRRPAQEREDMVYIWMATRKVRKDFPHPPPRMIAQIVHSHCLKHKKYPFKTVYGWVISSAIPMNETSEQKRRDKNGRPKRIVIPRSPSIFLLFFRSLIFSYSSFFKNF
jgi:hypothetical protein